MTADPRRVQPRKFLVNHYFQRGKVMMNSGRSADAEADYRHALDHSQRLVNDFPTVPEYRSQLVRVFGDLAMLLDSLGRYAEGADAARTARDHGRLLVKQYPDDAGYRQPFSTSLHNLAVTSHHAAGQPGPTARRGSARRSRPNKN